MTDSRRINGLGGFLLVCIAAATLTASASERMRYLYSAEERIVSPHPCEVVAHPYISDGSRVIAAKAGEEFGPLQPGSYLIRETLAPGKVRTRYLAVAAPGWTVAQLTCGTTGDKLDSVVHARRVPMNYYVGVGEAQADTTFLDWQREYGDEILLHLHPDSLGRIDPRFKTLKENWEAFTVQEIVERLKALDAWMQSFGFEPLRGFASYTPANTLVAAMREVGWDILHSIVPEQNWSDGHWAINHWGMPNQPFYIAADDFRKSAARGTAGRDVLGMGMNSYHLYMPHVVMWGDNVCSPSHFLRWHRTVESGDEPVRYGNFLSDYLKVAEGVEGSPYFLFTGYEFGRTFGTRSMTDHNRAGCEMAIDAARDGAKLVFATASDVADWFRLFRERPPESVFTQRDYLAGTRIMDKPIDSGPSVGMEMREYKACFAHLEPMPFYHYDYTVPWHFGAADTTAPHDFAVDDRERVVVARRNGGAEFLVNAKESLPRAVPVCLWDNGILDAQGLKSEVPGLRIFTPPVLDDGRRHTVVELPRGWSGELAIKARRAGRGPDKAEFGGIATPLWRVQTIGEGARRHSYAFLDTPVLSPCRIRFKCPRGCRIDALEKPLGAFAKGDVVELEFTTRRTWYRFWGLEAGEIQPDAEAVAAIGRTVAEWKTFSGNAQANLAKIHAADDEFFKSAVPRDERLLLDVDCFGNAVFGERSRARPFDRCVYAANGDVTAREYADGGISLGNGKSFWVHPRGLGFQVEGLDTLGLAPDATVRLRLCTVAGADEPPLSYRVSVRSGWKKIAGFEDAGQKRVVWNCPRERTADGLFVLDIPVRDIEDGVVNVSLRTNQKQVLDDWFADGGFIARLERIVVTALPARGGADAAAVAGTVWFNEDNEHFYGGHHPAEDMTEEGCRALVRTYAGFGGIKGILFCINMQRALYDSCAWERFRDQENPVAPVYPANLRLLSERGVDQFAVWIDETRRHGMKAYLTMRMNDSHGLKEFVHGHKDAKIYWWHSKMWERHPEWRRAPWRDERSWEGSFDFAVPEVRRHVLALVREAFAKWDFDGFEMDWMRWGMYFRPGAEREGAALLTELVLETGRIRDEAEKRVGHRIALAHRIPPDPRLALGHGFDVAAWADAGCVQMVTLSTFEDQSSFDPPVRLWRRLLRPGTEVNVAVARGIAANPFNRSSCMEWMRGGAAAAWAAGADGLYLFNECYLEPRGNDVLGRCIREIGSPEALRPLERWTAVVMESQAMPGDSTRAVLPMPLSNRYIGVDFSRMEQNMTVRLSAPLAEAGAKCALDLCFDEATPDEAALSLPVRVNTVPVVRIGDAVRRLRRDNVDTRPDRAFVPFGEKGDRFPRDAAKVVSFAVPGDVLRDFGNAVEMLPAFGTPGSLVWAQLRINVGDGGVEGGQAR